MEHINKFVTYDNTEIPFIIDTDNNKWFEAKPMCEFLKYVEINDLLKSNKIIKYVKKYSEFYKDNKFKSSTKFISESGVYRLLLYSEQDDALKIQEWLVEEVIPSIQNTGKYKFNKSSLNKYITNK